MAELNNVSLCHSLSAKLLAEISHGKWRKTSSVHSVSNPPVQQHNWQSSFFPLSLSLSLPHARSQICANFPGKVNHGGGGHNKMSKPTHRLSCRACLSSSITVEALGSEGRSCKTRLNSPYSSTFPSPSWLWFKLHCCSQKIKKRGLCWDTLPLLTTGLDSPLDQSVELWARPLITP